MPKLIFDSREDADTPSVNVIQFNKFHLKALNEYITNIANKISGDEPVLDCNFRTEVIFELVKDTWRGKEYKLKFDTNLSFNEELYFCNIMVSWIADNLKKIKKDGTNL